MSEDKALPKGLREEKREKGKMQLLNSGGSNTECRIVENKLDTILYITTSAYRMGQWCTIPTRIMARI